MLSLLCQVAVSPLRVLVDRRRRRLWELTGVFPKALRAGAQQAGVCHPSEHRGHDGLEWGNPRACQWGMDSRKWSLRTVEYDSALKRKADTVQHE